MLTERQFAQVGRLALQLAGIELVDRHRALLERRRKWTGLVGDGALEALLRETELQNPRARRQFLAWITTRFTGFFRHARQIETAAEHLLWAAHRKGRARVWSAAASTGEEPYSLAITLVEVFRRPDPPVEVLATDIDEVALETAQAARYREHALRGVDPARRRQFFAEDAGPAWAVSPELRRLVEFRPLNLAGKSWAVDGPFDVILLRNVVMYLEAGHRYAVLERMASLLGPDGLLVLDPAENTGGAGHFFTAGREGVYSRARTRRPGAAALRKPPAARVIS